MSSHKKAEDATPLPTSSSSSSSSSTNTSAQREEAVKTLLDVPKSPRDHFAPFAFSSIRSAGRHPLSDERSNKDWKPSDNKATTGFEDWRWLCGVGRNRISGSRSRATKAEALAQIVAAKASSRSTKGDESSRVGKPEPKFSEITGEPLGDVLRNKPGTRKQRDTDQPQDCNIARHKRCKLSHRNHDGPPAKLEEHNPPNAPSPQHFVKFDDSTKIPVCFTPPMCEPIVSLITALARLSISSCENPEPQHRQKVSKPSNLKQPNAEAKTKSVRWKDTVAADIVTGEPFAGQGSDRRYLQWELNRRMAIDPLFKMKILQQRADTRREKNNLGKNWNFEELKAHEFGENEEVDLEPELRQSLHTARVHKHNADIQAVKSGAFDFKLAVTHKYMPGDEKVWESVVFKKIARLGTYVGEWIDWVAEENEMSYPRKFYENPGTALSAMRPQEGGEPQEGVEPQGSGEPGEGGGL